MHIVISYLWWDYNIISYYISDYNHKTHIYEQIYDVMCTAQYDTLYINYNSFILKYSLQHDKNIYYTILLTKIGIRQSNMNITWKHVFN